MSILAASKNAKEKNCSYENGELDEQLTRETQMTVEYSAQNQQTR